VSEIERIKRVRNINSGRIFVFTSTLAERTDMQVVMVNPDDLNDYEIMNTNDVPEVEKLRSTIGQLEAELATVRAENLALKKELGIETNNNTIGIGKIDMGNENKDGEKNSDKLNQTTVDMLRFAASDNLELLSTELNKLGKDDIEIVGRNLPEPIELDRRFSITKMVEAVVEHLTPAE